MGNVSDIILGLSKSIDDYTKGQTDRQQAAYQSQLDTQKELTVNAAKNAGDDSAPEANMNPDMAEKLLPGAGGQLVQAFQQQNGRLPTMKEAHDYLKQAADSIQPPADTEKQDKHQDLLENQAINRISSVRGDAAVARSELQRDAAGQAYDTISKAQHEGRALTSLEQTDLLAQLMQARKGSAPTSEDMKMINDKTAKMSLNQAITYVTGDPSLVGASTDKTLDNLKQFVQSTGMKADSNHDGYMAPHLVKPTGLSDDRWQHIMAAHRGISFSDQMKTSDKTYSKAATKASSAAATSNGWSYVGPVGK